MKLPFFLTPNASKTHDEHANHKLQQSTRFSGMISHWESVLEIALGATDATQAIPDVLFRECHGIVLLQVLEASFMFGASMGTGMLFSHVPEENKWSAPCAVGVTGVSWGCMGGVAHKNVLVFIMDADTMSALSRNFSLNLGGQASLTLGQLGRHVDTTWHASHGGVGATVAFSYTRGLMAGVSLEASVVATRHEHNAEFYGRPVTTAQVLEDMRPPESAKKLYSKLETLASPDRVVQREDPSDVWYHVSAQTQTGEEECSEDESTVAGMEPPVEIIKTANTTTTTTTTTTQTEFEFVTCQVAQTQTGGQEDMLSMDHDDEMEPPIIVNTKSIHDFIDLVQVEVQTQTDGIVLVQSAQTQTGEHGNDDEAMIQEPLVETKQPTSMTAMLQQVQTQTETHNDTMDDDDDFVLCEMEHDEEDLEVVSSRDEIQREIMNGEM